MDVALSGQWSGMPSFSLIIYSYFSDKSVYCLNFTLQWSPVSKSTILESMSFIFELTGDNGCCSQWSISGMPSFSLIIYSYI